MVVFNSGAWRDASPKRRLLSEYLSSHQGTETQRCTKTKMGRAVVDCASWRTICDMARSEAALSQCSYRKRFRGQGLFVRSVLTEFLSDIAQRVSSIFLDREV
jgi:hypothetical protein